MTKTTEAARKLAQELKARNALGEPWRAIAESFCSPIVKAGTLWRIAAEAGEWLPKDRKILMELGLIERKQRTEHEIRIRKKIDSMARKTRRAMLGRKE
jgi:hypothetical protein